MAKSDFSRALLSIVGALALSATFVLAAVGPAKAAAPATAVLVAPAVY